MHNAQIPNRPIRHRLANRRPTNRRSHDTPSHDRAAYPESMAKLMKTAQEIITCDHLTEFEITAYKSLQERWPTGKTKYSTSVNLYIDNEEDPSYSVWTLGELFHLTISIWSMAIKAALGKRI